MTASGSNYSTGGCFHVSSIVFNLETGSKYWQFHRGTDQSFLRK